MLSPISVITRPFRRIFTSPVLMLALSVFTEHLFVRIQLITGIKISSLFNSICRVARDILIQQGVFESPQAEGSFLLVIGVVLAFMFWMAVFAGIRWISEKLTNRVARHFAWIRDVVATQRGRTALYHLERLHAVRTEDTSEYDWLKMYVYGQNNQSWGAWGTRLVWSVISFLVGIVVLAKLMEYACWVVFGVSPDILSFLWGLLTAAKTFTIG